MMTMPKVKPCPKCGGKYGDHVGLIEWDSGWKQVLCYQCDHRSFQHGRFIQAVRDWNAEAVKAAHPTLQPKDMSNG